MKKTMMKLLSVVMALMMLFGCFSTLAFAAAPHEHDKTTKLETVSPRCNAYGYTLYTCSCGETWATDIVAKTEGTHSDAIGETKDVPAKAPTCEEDGMSAAKACIWCDKILEGGEKAGDKTGHNEQWVLVAADCNNPERIEYKCVNDNCDKIDNSKTIYLDDHAADGHNFKYNITKDPKCELVASAFGTLNRVANGELLSGYTLTTAPGEAEYECTDCGVKYTGIVVEWHSHRFVSRDNGLEDDCYNFKATWTECIECGLAKDYVYTDVVSHILIGEGNVPATCYSNGHAKCNREGCEYEADLPKIEHNMVTINPATCVSNGSEICTNPGCIYAEQIPATGHDMGTDLHDGDIAATCSSEGKDFCANGCGYFVPTSKLSHIFGTTEVFDVAPTCAVMGRDYCSRGCGTYRDIAIDESKHNFQYVCGACTGVCHDCTHAGRQYKCQNTGCVKATDAKFDAHAWDTAKYYSYYRNDKRYTGPYTSQVFCSTVDLYVACTNPACECENKVGNIPGAPTASNHINLVFVNDTDYVAPTCTADGYIMVNCTECGMGHQKLEGQAAYNFFASEVTRLSAITPLTAEITYLIARYNQYVDEDLADYRPLLALGHKSTIIADANGAVEDRLPTCYLEGYQCEIKCDRVNNGTVCGYVQREEKVLAKDLTNHTIPRVVTKSDATSTWVGYEYDDAYVLIVEYEATCYANAISYYKCSKCDNKKYVEDTTNGFDEFNHVDIKRLDNFLLDERIVDPFTKHDAVEAVCGGADGSKQYYTCNKCNKIVIVDGIREADNNNNNKRDTGDKLFTEDDLVIHWDHIFESVAAQKETCTTDGWEAYNRDCSRCGAATPKSKIEIPAHGDDYAFTITPEMAYAPLCLTPGVAAGRYCAKCSTKDYVAVSGTWTYNAKKLPDISKPKSTEPWYIAPVGHTPFMTTLLAPELARVTVVEGECVKTSYGVKYCTNCLDGNYNTLTDILLGRSEEEGKKVASGAWVIFNYVEPIFHIYPEAIYEDDAANGIYANVSDNFTGVVDFDNCATDKLYTVDCKNCGEDKVVKTEVADGHYYYDGGEKVYIDLACTKFTDKIVSCVECGKKTGTDILPKHNIVEVVNYPGCLPGEDGERFWACSDCDARYFADDSDPFATPVDPESTGSDYGYVDIIPVISENHDFYKFSTDADGNLLFQEPTEEADGYISRECTKCGTVTEILPKLAPTLNIEVEAEKSTVASGDTFAVELTYAGDYTKFNALQVKLAYDVEKLKFLAEGFDEELPAGVAVKEENNGIITITVYSLDGIEPGEAGATLKIFFRARNNFEESDVVVITSATAYATAGGVPVSADELNIVAVGDTAAITSVVTGELNGFAGIDAGDAIVMMDLIYSKQYNAAADMDKDGKVTVADFAILSKLIATDGSDDAYKVTINTQVTAKNGIYYTRISY